MVLVFDKDALLARVRAEQRRKRRRQLCWAGLWLVLYATLCGSMFIFVP